MSSNPEGIINPPIDDLLTKSDSKYGLVIFGAKTSWRAPLPKSGRFTRSP